MNVSWLLRSKTMSRFVKIEMTLGDYDSFEAAKVGFQQQCNKPGALTIARRGEVLVTRFAGVQIDQSEKRRVISGINDQEDLENFKQESKDRMEKGKWRLDADRQGLLENTGSEPTPLLNVSADIEKARQFYQELEQHWIEQLESEGVTKQKDASAPNTVVKSAGLKAMGCQAVQSMQDTRASRLCVVYVRYKDQVQQCVPDDNEGSVQAGSRSSSAIFLGTWIFERGHFCHGFRTSDFEPFGHGH